jgi:hypothetical protein
MRPAPVSAWLIGLTALLLLGLLAGLLVYVGPDGLLP